MSLTRREFGRRFAAVALGCGLVQGVALGLQARSEWIAAVWPASGLALGVVLLLGREMVPAAVLGLLAANAAWRVLAGRQGVDPAWVAGAVIPALAAGLNAWAAAEWVRRFCGGVMALRRGGWFFRFLAGAAMVVPLGTAGLAVGLLGLTGRVPVEAAWPVGMAWWQAVAVGNLVVFPLLLAWVTPNFSRFRARPAEGVVVLALLVFAGHFLVSAQEVAVGFPRSFLIVPLVLWIGYRFRALGVTTALMLLVAALMFFTPPAAWEGGAIGQMQLFLVIVSVVGLGFVAVLEERDASLAELVALNDQLERKVEARTRKLQRINQELTDAVSIVAHDVRGPVAGIRTLAHHMRWAALDLSTAEGDALLAEIERTSATAEATMAHLLEFQRANHPLIELEPSLVGELVAEACREHEKAAAGKGITLQVIRPAREIPLLVDAEGVKFIAGNLVSNALKFLPAGGRIEVRVRVGRTGAQLAVVDDGPGIAPKELAGIFRRFTRSANRPTRGESSTGLGLFIVRKLVLAMEGTLYVETAPGHGATFVVEWPAEAG